MWLFVGLDQFCAQGLHRLACRGLFVEPDNLKEQAIKRYATEKGKKYDSEKKEMVTTYNPMTWQQMQQAVGAFIADPEATKAQNLTRRMAGEDAPKGLGWGETEHTTDDEQTDW